jgi:hypothetical protein
MAEKMVARWEFVLVSQMVDHSVDRSVAMKGPWLAVLLAFDSVVATVE